MGRLHAEQGDLAGAIAAYRQAVEITPHSVARAQKYGILAWYAAAPDEALAALEHAARIGGDSPQFDHQTLLLLAMARFQNGDAAGLQQCHKQLAAALGRQPARPAAADAPPDPRADRLRRLAQMTQALVGVQTRDRPLVQSSLVPVADDLLAPGFDIESATNLLSLIATSQAAGLSPQQGDDWVRRAGLRFCVSKQVTEMLAKACDPAPTLAQLVRTAHAEINEISRTALSEGLAGRHQRAVEALLQAVERTRNAKLLELAQAALDRHRANIAAADALAERCGVLQALCSTAGRSHLLVNDSGSRPAGGVELPARSAWRREPQAAPA
jgi:tetratricopeptide (TPR) repeat protein